MASKEAGRDAMLFDVEEGEEINIEADDDTEVEPVKKAIDPGKPTDQQIEEHRMPTCRTGHGADGAYLAVDVVYSTVYAQDR
jgi:hypothetical protein